MTLAAAIQMLSKTKLVCAVCSKVEKSFSITCTGFTLDYVEERGSVGLCNADAADCHPFVKMQACVLVCYVFVFPRMHGM